MDAVKCNSARAEVLVACSWSTYLHASNHCLMSVQASIQRTVCTKATAPTALQAAFPQDVQQSFMPSFSLRAENDVPPQD